MSRMNAERAARATFGLGIPPLQVDAVAGRLRPGLVGPSGRHRARWPTRPCRRPARGPSTHVVHHGRQLRQQRQRVLAGGRLGRDGRDVHGLGPPPPEHAGRRLHRRRRRGDLQRRPGLDRRGVRLHLRRPSPRPWPARTPRTPCRASRCRPPRWSPGRPAGNPVYCPGQTVAADGTVTPTGGQFPYPFRVASIAGEPNLPAPSVGMAATADANGYWLAHTDGSVSTHGDAVNYGSMAGSPLNAPVSHIVATTDGRGYWMVAVRRRHLLLRRRRLLRVDGREAPERPGGRHGPDRHRPRLLAGGLRRRRVRLRGRRSSTGPWGAST